MLAGFALRVTRLFPGRECFLGRRASEKEYMMPIRFEIETPLGFTVRTTEGYWQRIVTMKHRTMRITKKR